MAMNEIFPPDQFLGTNGFEILNEVNIIEEQGFNQEIEGLLNKFAGSRPGQPSGRKNAPFIASVDRM